MTTSRLASALVLAGLVSLAAPGLSAALAQAGDDDTPSLDDIPHITMVGHARTEVPPDLATLTLGIVQERPTAVAAADAAARGAAAIVATAKAQGVPPADLRTQAVTLTQTFDDTYDAQGRPTGRKPRGFEASQSIAVRTRDLGKVGAITQALIASGANRFDGIGFSVDHPEAIVARLTGTAVADAKTQAVEAARAAGVRLGRLLQIERPADAARPPVVFASRLAAAAPGTTSVEPGLNAIDTSVEVTWAIDDR